MQPNFSISPSNGKLINERASLQQFYSLTNLLSKIRSVRFIRKSDEADSIEWHFKYRGKQLMLQFDIYNGLSLYQKDGEDLKLLNTLLEKLKGKSI